MNKIKYIILTIAICFFVVCIVFPLNTLAVTEYRCFNTGCAVSAGGPYTTSNCDGKCVAHCLGDQGSVCLHTDSDTNTPTCTSDSDCSPSTLPETSTSSETTRYRCDHQNRKCIEDSNGIYSSLSACGDLCYQVPADCSDKYMCLFGECLSDDNGNFGTLAQCLNYCGQPSANLVTRYRCNTSGGLYQCEEDVNGHYSPLSSCEIICQPGGSLSCPGNEYCWACSQETLQCYQSERGTRTSQYGCQANCKPCNSTGGGSTGGGSTGGGSTGGGSTGGGSTGGSGSGGGNINQSAYYICHPLNGCMQGSSPFSGTPFSPYGDSYTSSSCDNKCVKRCIDAGWGVRCRYSEDTSYSRCTSVNDCSGDGNTNQSAYYICHPLNGCTQPNVANPAGTPFSPYGDSYTSSSCDNKCVKRCIDAGWGVRCRYSEDTSYSRCASVNDCSGNGNTNQYYICDPFNGCMQKSGPSPETPFSPYGDSYTSSSCDNKCVKRCINAGWGVRCRYSEDTSYSRCASVNDCSGTSISSPSDESAITTKYSCNTSKWTCEEDTNGTYSYLLDCNAGCIEPNSMRYSCNTSTWQCEENINGENSSLSKCQYNCVSPTIKRYSCNTSTGKCERDSHGIYSCIIACNRKCSIASTTPPATAGPMYISPPPATPPSTSGPIYISPPPNLVPRSGENPPAGDPWNLDYWLKFWLGGFLRGIWK